MKKMFQGERDDSPNRVSLRENKSRRDGDGKYILFFELFFLYLPLISTTSEKDGGTREACGATSIFVFVLR